MDQKSMGTTRNQVALMIPKLEKFNNCMGKKKNKNKQSKNQKVLQVSSSSYDDNYLNSECRDQALLLSKQAKKKHNNYMPKSLLHKKKGSKVSRSKGKALDVEIDDESMSIDSLEIIDFLDDGGDSDSKSYSKEPMEPPKAPKIIEAI
jgi:hypothetical protein